MTILKMEQISKKYNLGKINELEALKGVSAEIEQGEWVAVTGKSGSGKSTFLHIAALADRYTGGKLYFEGECMNHKSQSAIAEIRKRKIGFVLQDFGLLWNMSVFDNIATPLYMEGVHRKERKEKVWQIAEELGVADLLSKKAKQLSGGQSQRVAIARAVIKSPDIIFADEPTGALDKKTAEQVMDIFSELHSRGTTIVMVTHDMELAEKCQRNIIIEDGQIK